MMFTPKVIMPSAKAYNEAAFLKFITIDIIGQIILLCGGVSVNCRMFIGIHGLYLLDADSTPSPQL